MFTADTAMVDASLSGVRLSHLALFQQRDDCRIEFEWDGRPIQFAGQVRWTKLQRIGAAAFSKSVYQSGLEIAAITPPAQEALRRLIQSHIERAFDEQRANARGIPPLDVQSVLSGQTSQFARHELIRGVRDVGTRNFPFFSTLRKRCSRRRVFLLVSEPSKNTDAGPVDSRWNAGLVLSLHDVHLECHACSREAIFSGIVEEKEDGYWAHLRCPLGHCDFVSQRPEWSPFFKEHVRKQQQDSNYREWAAALVSWDSNRIVGFIEQLQFCIKQGATPLPAPFFRSGWLPVGVLTKVNDVVPVLLAYPAFVLAPRRIDRAMEATVAALKRASLTDTTRCAEWITRHLTDEECHGYVDSLDHLFGSSESVYNRGKYERSDPPDAASIKNLLQELSARGCRDDLVLALQEWRKIFQSLEEQFGNEFADRLLPWWKGLQDFQFSD